MISGLVLASFRRIDRTLSPTIQLLAGVPIVVWIPFWVMFFGTDEVFKIAMAAIGTFFLVHLHTFVAVRAIDHVYLELAAIYEKRFWQRVRHVLIPAATPSIFTAIRTSIALGWIVIFFVEYASARQGSEGLGWFIADARAVGKVDEEFAGLLALAIIAFVVDLLIGLAQGRLAAWKDSLDSRMYEGGR